ncbi:uncharacterized protein LOC113339706 [Papaver somniferum]|uniref:uncharacterized protein LOC113339706 n=1 Tax=Papaver somniferum TaxID=3469 RepID=UPI000E6F4FCD|nr:uncharacterized protein LOC113339706 [Papaver somniferum]
MVVTRTLWNTRRDVHFQNLKIEPQAVAKKALSFSKYIENLYNRQQHDSFIDKPSVHIEQLWTPPDFLFIKANYDASYDPDNGLTGVAVILRDGAGNWRGGLSKCYAGIRSSEQAECVTFYDAVKWCEELQISQVIVETDLKGIENYINNAAPVISWESETILLDAIDKLKFFIRWNCSFVSRKCNKTADTLAKYRRQHKVSRI